MKNNNQVCSEKKKINAVILCRDGASSRAIFHALKDDVKIEMVIVESKPSTYSFFVRRIRRMGFWKVFGQLMFLILNVFLSHFRKKMKDSYINSYGLSQEKIPEQCCTFVNSINNETVKSLLRKMKADIIIVNGTRIISAEILSLIDCPVINTHMGITPKYRGVHGGYWALVHGDKQHCGVTVHLVDEGVDTGGVLYQNTIMVEKQDNFSTYPVHQLALAIPLIKQVIRDVEQHSLIVRDISLESNVWSHPTIYEYLTYWIQKGIK